MASTSESLIRKRSLLAVLKTLFSLILSFASCRFPSESWICSPMSSIITSRLSVRPLRSITGVSI